jgi:Cu/Ag efflux protein CusF
MTSLASTAAVLAVALLAACEGDKRAAPARTPAVHTGVPAAPAQATSGASAGEVTGIVLETQQGALLHVHIQRADGQKMTLVCDRQCFPKMELLKEGRRVRVQWQRQRVKGGDEVFDADVITQVETP